MRYFHRSGLRLILLLSAVSMVSCTIQKRQRLSGYHIEWLTRGSETDALRHQIHPVSVANDAQLEREDSQFAARVRNEEGPTASSKEHGPSYFENEFAFYGKLLAGSLSQPKNDSCDLIITRQGEFIYASTIDEEENIIRFTICNDSVGSRKIISKESLFMIKYRDGTKLVLDDSKDKEEVSKEVREKTIKPKPNKGFRFIDEVSFVGFIFGIGSVPTWLFYWQMGFFMSIFAILMGVVGIIRVVKSKGSRTGLGFAIISLILGVAMFIATLVVWLPALA